MAIMRVLSQTCSIFRSFLEDRGFTEIHTPKLTTFDFKYSNFKVKSNLHSQPVFLTSTTDLYKQMAVQADFGPVYEVSTCCKNVNRGLVEYTRLDFEMPIFSSYDEVIDITIDVLKQIIDHIQTKCTKELSTHPNYTPIRLDNICRLSFAEMIEKSEPFQLYRSHERNYLTVSDIHQVGADLSQNHDIDIIVVDRRPTMESSFYVMPSVDNSTTNSFYVLVRGQKVASGAQHINDAHMLLELMREKQVHSSLDTFVECMRYGALPLGGSCISLERLIEALLRLSNIRQTVLFSHPHDELLAFSV
jgi:aspartyl/asparaginyl-tRNA synthetase